MCSRWDVLWAQHWGRPTSKREAQHNCITEISMPFTLSAPYGLIHLDKPNESRACIDSGALHASRRRACTSSIDTGLACPLWLGLPLAACRHPSTISSRALRHTSAAGFKADAAAATAAAAAAAAQVPKKEYLWTRGPTGRRVEAPTRAWAT